MKEVSIEILRKCPNNCLHCSSMSDVVCDEILEYDKFVEVVSDTVKLGANTICISGGEPFLHDRLVDMVEFVASQGVQVYIYTSGIVDYNGHHAALDKTILKAISKNVTKLIFNIQTAQAGIYDEIMGTKDCFEKMKQSVLDAHRFSIITEAHFVPMKLNFQDVDSVIDLCKELNISKLSFLRLVPHGRAFINEFKIALSSDELAYFKVKLSEIQKQSDVDIRIGTPLSKERACHKCEAAKGKLNIKYDGYVYPCEIFKNDYLAHSLRGITPDSIHEKSLFDIYNDSQYLGLVRNLVQEFSCGSQDESCIGQYFINFKDSL